MCANSEQTSDPISFFKTQEDSPLKLKTSSLLIAATLFGAAVMPAQANNDAMLDLLKVLRDQGTITAQNYELLANAAKADKESLDAVDTKVANVEKKAKKAADNGVKIDTKGKIKISGNGWTFQPIGRVMWDAIASDDDGLTAAGFGDEFSGTELRRARLGFQGSVNKSWIYKFEADFATGGASDSNEIAIKDAYVGYKGGVLGNKFSVKAGQSMSAFGFNTPASSKYMTFIDRPFYGDSNISHSRLSGLAVSFHPKDYSWKLDAAIQKGGLKDGVSDEDEATTFTTRGSFLPYHADDKHMVQFSVSYMNKSGDGKFKYGPDLVAHEDGYGVDSTSISAGDFDGLDVYDIAALGIYGPFHVLAEYVDASAERQSGTDIDIDAFSIEAGYFLTGESFKWSKGLSGGVTPKAKSGAWQVAARYETTDADNDDVAKIAQADKYTLGLNYIANKNIRLMLDYSKIIDLETSNGTDVDGSPSSIAFRAQAKW